MRTPGALVAALAVVGGIVGGCGGDLIVEPRILVSGDGVIQDDCRTQVCRHNENTDLTTFGGAIYLVHRTAQSQILNHNCALRVYKSTDGGAHFALLGIIPGPTAAADPALGDRDLRDPSFDVVDGQLAIKALVRKEIASTRDSDVDTIAVLTTSPDGGATWTPLAPIGPPTWSYWRIKDHGGMHYAAAYEDGDRRVKLFASADGRAWTPGAVIYDVAADTPLETELVFMPSGRLLALVRMDGTDDELLGNHGRLRTKICWAMPPYDTFACPQEFTDQRLDGPVAFWHGDRLFVVARKHFLEDADRKRTALFEIGGTLEGGPLTITERGVLPSAGDTAYAGVADLDADHVLVTWYSSSVVQDEPWARAIFEDADIWQATLDLSQL
jgi:hypothetical protein